ncbi:MAG: hypothetical protein QGI37_05190 [Verrucomicrobiota bacterium]|nr:hypothetical protein [Verrucomicrobiota bacterium]
MREGTGHCVWFAAPTAGFGQLADEVPWVHITSPDDSLIEAPSFTRVEAKADLDGTGLEQDALLLRLQVDHPTRNRAGTRPSGVISSV